ncbi:MAG: Xaa-Pro aminopeptidase [Spirosomataceae bacterium]|jgi:Xaa-Pro aminopeptidase
MKLFSPETYTKRRQKLMKTVGSGLILLCGNDEAPMNYEHNTYRYRQDSTFLYYFGLNFAGLNATLNCETDEVTLFGNELTIDDIIIVGPQAALAELAEKVGVPNVQPTNKLSSQLSKGKKVHFLPPYRFENKQKLSNWLGIAVIKLADNVSDELVHAVVAQRQHKTAEEVVEMEAAVNASRAMHIAAMRATQVGKKEYEIVAELYGTAKRLGGELAYPAILSINGQTLHNHYHGNELTSGRLLLNDSGVELEMGYCGDITRTFPVDKKFTQQQREIYEIVLEMEELVIESLKPGTQYRDCHIASNRLMLNKFKDLGIVNGDVEEMLEAGVGGMFMPHGLGHMIGLDVHDMEDLGEKFVGYNKDIERSAQMGLKSLRLAKELAEGFVITVEPGIYFIPQLIDKLKADKQYLDFVNYDKLEQYRDFGGIRIEDDILITKDGYQVLGEHIPKTVAEIEDLRHA